MRDEITGNRDMTWSEWHRCQPAPLYGVDVDWVEACKACKEPLAVIELTSIPFTEHKQSWVCKLLAEKAGIRHYTIWYKQDEIMRAIAPFDRNAHGERHAALMQSSDIVFQIRNERGEFRKFTSRQLNALFMGLHCEHDKQCKKDETQ